MSEYSVCPDAMPARTPFSVRHHQTHEIVAVMLRPSRKMQITNLSMMFVLGLLVSAPVSHAQLPQIRLDATHPAGAQRGTTTEVSVLAGRDLDEADNLLFSHPGIRAVQKTNADGTPIAGQFVVSVDSVVPPGIYDVRVHGLFGISNPRSFRIDELVELSEQEPNNDVESANQVTLETIHNGRSDKPGDVDMYRIMPATSGVIVAKAEAAILGSLMQPVIELFDPHGRQLAVSRRILTQDAAIVFEAKAGEELLLTVRDVVYGGGTGYPYRLVVDTRPFAEFALPSVPDQPVAAAIDVFGRHLPNGQPTKYTIDGQPVFRKSVTVPIEAWDSADPGIRSATAPARTVNWTAPGGQVLTLARPAHAMFRHESTSDEVSNDDLTVEIPASVCGFFEVPGDSDAVRFSAVAEQSLSIRVLSEQIGSIADPVLTLEQVITNAETGAESFKRLATEDDSRQNPGGNNLPTVTADPSYVFKVPANGVYRVVLRDRYVDSRGDPRLSWMLNIANAAPDFGLVVFDAIPNADEKQPSTTGSISIRRGGSYSLAVYAWRSSDCTQPIHLSATGLPDGLTCNETVIPSGQTKGTLVFTADDSVAEGVLPPFHIVGRSTPVDKEITRLAQVATLVHGAINGLPRTTRRSELLTVGVMKDLQPFSLRIEVDDLIVSQDQHLSVPITVQRHAGFAEKVDVSIKGLPGNVDAPGASIPKDQDRTVIKLFFKENAGVQAATIYGVGVGSVPYRRNPWLSERADAKLKAAQEALASCQTSLDGTKTQLDAANASVSKQGEEIKTIQAEMQALQGQQEKLQSELAEANGNVVAAAKVLVGRQDLLSKLQVSAGLSPKAIDAAVHQVTDASQKAQQASEQAAQLATRLNVLVAQMAELQTTLAGKVQQTAKLTSETARLQQAVTKVTGQVDDAQRAVDAADAARKAAEELAKKAAEATKPKNVNVRAISPARIVTVHPAIGKVTAAVPDGGKLARGATLQVKVTVARKNSFDGEFQVSLSQPDDKTGLSTEAVTIPADQSEVMLSIAAAADAPVGAKADLFVIAAGTVDAVERVCDVSIALTIVE
jgi:peptidoglycan hydrolase CwlO-like protein